METVDGMVNRLLTRLSVAGGASGCGSGLLLRLEAALVQLLLLVLLPNEEAVEPQYRPR